jgi:hypothetical protein
MTQSTSLMRLSLAVVIAGMIFFTDAMAQKIIWVSGYYKNADSVFTDQAFVDALVGHGYVVQREAATMSGNPLTPEQLAVLESGDLIIFSRASGSGDYMDAVGWNSITKPMILNNVWVARLGRWQWTGTDNLVNGGNAGCPPFHAELPEHPIFTGVTLDANGMVLALDTTVGTGQTSICDYKDFGDGELIATAVPGGQEAIVYWATGSVFYNGGSFVAGGPRMLFSCQTREGGAFLVGMYNLTPEGQKMYLNAVAFMLGNSNGISEESGAVPADYALEQNYPNPFNPSTRIAFTLHSTSVTKISVYNLLSQEIAVLAEGTFQAGKHEVVWNGRDRFGNPMPSGVYLYQMNTGDRIQARKMLLLK